VVLRRVLMPGTPVVWRNQTRPDERLLDIGDVPRAVATLRSSAKAPMPARGLLIRAQPDGRVRIPSTNNIMARIFAAFAPMLRNLLPMGRSRRAP